MKFKRHSQVERNRIQFLLKVVYDQIQIAKLLDQHKFTIIRQLILNTDSRGYSSNQNDSYGQNVLRSVAIAQPLSLGYVKRPVFCCKYNLVQNELPQNCPSVMKCNTSKSMQTNRKSELFKKLVLSEPKVKELCGRSRLA